MLLRAMIFASNPDIIARIHRRCVTSGHIDLYRSPDYRPSPPDMVRMINSFSPETVLVEVYDPDDALKVAEVIHQARPNLAILGIADNWPHEPILKTSSGHLRIVPSNLSLEGFQEAILSVLNSARPSGPDNIIVFLPAKAGSGASTVALNVTGALANKCGKSSILIEADLHSGPAAMYLNLKPAHSVLDALSESHNLDAGWNSLITPVGKFAILPACSVRGNVPMPSPWAYRRLIAFTRHRYDFVVFDLPEVVNIATEAIVTSAKMVYVVCTPEVPSLTLARKRAAGLIQRGVREDRVQVVLNRYAKDGPDPAAIAEILGYPIGQVIPNDYSSLWDANIQRCLVSDRSAVGCSFEEFAWNLTGRPVTTKPRRLFGLFPAA
jgi:Flp pilus assembly CpaE family ATPase